MKTFKGDSGIDLQLDLCRRSLRLEDAFAVGALQWETDFPPGLDHNQPLPDTGDMDVMHAPGRHDTEGMGVITQAWNTILINVGWETVPLPELMKRGEAFLVPMEACLRERRAKHRLHVEQQATWQAEQEAKLLLEKSAQKRSSALTR
jgi:hypothetical protein